METLPKVIAACDREGFSHITLCPETMGKINQLGDLAEVLTLCTLDSRLVPCIDFGHLYARSLGELEGERACAEMLDQVLFTQKDSGLPVSNIVLMGIGEPLDNLDTVLKFLELVNHPDGMNIGCGISPSPPGSGSIFTFLWEATGRDWRAPA